MLGKIKVTKIEPKIKVGKFVAEIKMRKMLGKMFPNVHFYYNKL